MTDRYAGEMDQHHTEDGQFDQVTARAALEAEQEQVLERFEQIDEPEEQVAGFDEGFADSGQAAAGESEVRTIAAQMREQLTEIDAALARLEAGTYGTCEVCGEAIPADRLEAMPTTRFCIEHAT